MTNYARGGYERRVKKFNRKIIGPESFQKITVSMDPVLAQKVYEYHEALVSGGIVGYPNDTMRELVQLGLSADPTELIPLVDRRRAFNETRLYMFRKMGSTFADILAELRLLAAQANMDEPFEPGVGGPDGNHG